MFMMDEGPVRNEEEGCAVGRKGEAEEGGLLCEVGGSGAERESLEAPISEGSWIVELVEVLLVTHTPLGRNRRSVGGRERRRKQCV